MFSTQYLDALGGVLRMMFFLAIIGVISIASAIIVGIGFLIYWLV